MEQENSKSGVTGTPTGFNVGSSYRANLVPSSRFRWSGPLTVIKSVEWSDERGGFFRLTMSDGSTPICLFERLPSDEDRRLVAAAIRSIVLDTHQFGPECTGLVLDPMPTVVQLAVAGSSSHSAFFCGVRLHQQPSEAPAGNCPW